MCVVRMKHSCGSISFSLTGVVTPVYSALSSTKWCFYFPRTKMRAAATSASAADCEGNIIYTVVGFVYFMVRVFVAVGFQ